MALPGGGAAPSPPTAAVGRAGRYRGRGARGAAGTWGGGQERTGGAARAAAYGTAPAPPPAARLRGAARFQRAPAGGEGEAGGMRTELPSRLRLRNALVPRGVHRTGAIDEPLASPAAASLPGAGPGPGSAGGFSTPAPGPPAAPLASPRSTESRTTETAATAVPRPPRPTCCPRGHRAPQNLRPAAALSPARDTATPALSRSRRTQKQGSPQLHTVRDPRFVPHNPHLADAPPRPGCGGLPRQPTCPPP